MNSEYSILKSEINSSLRRHGSAQGQAESSHFRSWGWLLLSFVQEKKGLSHQTKPGTKTPLPSRTPPTVMSVSAAFLLLHLPVSLPFPPPTQRAATPYVSRPFLMNTHVFWRGLRIALGLPVSRGRRPGTPAWPRPRSPGAPRPPPPPAAPRKGPYPPARTVTCPSTWPFSTGASTDSLRLTSRVAAAASPLLTRMLPALRAPASPSGPCPAVPSPAPAPPRAGAKPGRSWRIRSREGSWRRRNADRRSRSA